MAGALKTFRAAASGGTVAAVCDGAYAGVGMERTLTLRGERLKDVFIVRSDSLHTYDYVLLLTQRPGSAALHNPRSLANCRLTITFRMCGGMRNAGNSSSKFRVRGSA